MALVDRDVQIRGHIMGVLVGYNGKTLTNDMINTMADDLLQTVRDGEIHWFNQFKEESAKNMDLDALQEAKEALGLSDVPQ